MHRSLCHTLSSTKSKQRPYLRVPVPVHPSVYLKTLAALVQLNMAFIYHGLPHGDGTRNAKYADLKIRLLTVHWHHPPHRPLIVRLPLLPMILPESNLTDMTL